jgi:hypothetical protein
VDAFASQNRFTAGCPAEQNPTIVLRLQSGDNDALVVSEARCRRSVESVRGDRWNFDSEAATILTVTTALSVTLEETDQPDGLCSTILGS